MRAHLSIAVLIGVASVAMGDGAPALLSIDAATRADAASPVRVRGIATYVDVDRTVMCIQDGASGLFARIPAETTGLRPGQQVELVGKIATRHFMEATEARAIGDGPVPASIPVLPGDFAAAKFVNRRVTLAGVVRSASPDGNYADLRLMFGRNRIRLSVCDLPIGPVHWDRFVDAEVQVTGICAPAPDDRSRPDTNRLLVQSLNDISIVRKAPENVADMPICEIRDLPEWSPHRVRVAGEVAGEASRGMITIQAGDRQCRLTLPAGVFPRAGERVEVVGFPGRRDGEAFLDDCQVRVFCRRRDFDPHAANPNEPVPIIQSVTELRRLRAEEVRRGHPVRLQSVVTFHDPATRTLFVHDGAEGMLVHTPAQTPPLSAGTVVLVDGHSDADDFAPSTRASQVTPLRDGRLPDARRYGYHELVGGREHCQWIEFEAVVRGASRGENGVAYLMLRFGPTTTPAQVAGTEPESLRRLFGTTVRVRAVCGSKVNTRRQWDGVVLYIPSAEVIEVRRPAPPDLSVLAPRTVESLSQFDPDLGPGEPVKLMGRIISRRGPAIALQDSTGGIAVELQPGQPGGTGDRVEVLGFLYRRGNMWALEDGQSRLVNGMAEAPGPLDVSAAEVAAGGYSSTLIRVQGTLLEQFPAGETDHVFLLQSTDETGGQRVIFPAVLPRDQLTQELIDLQPGTRLRLSGACGMPYDRSMIASFRLFLRNANDIEVVEHPAWWTPRKALAAAFGIAAIAIVAMTWVVTLRRQVRAQTEQIRRRLEAEARLEERYRELFEGANDAVFTLDSHAVVTTMNAAGRKLTGLKDRDSFLAAVAPESLAAARELLACQAPITREINLNGPNGNVLLEVNARPVGQAGSSSGVQAIARDLTQRRRLEEELRQAQKMEAIGRLAGGVAHDFNNLLTVINGNAEVLRARLSAEETMFADEIARAGEHAAALTGQLLSFSRKGVVAPRILCPCATIANLRGLLARLVGEHVELTTELNESAGRVRIDPAQLEQVLVNLAVNARDAMPKGGRLTIRARPHASRVRIEVIDTGAGMDAATRAQIFEPFFTTKPAGEGTGLGLATVKSIVEQAGGTIAVHSEPGRGSTFAIEFPRCGDAVSSPSPIPPSPGSGNREVILLVEDEPAVQLLERRVLETGKYEVLVASNGAEALNLLDKHQGRIDLLVTDVVMPGMSGRELAEAVSRRRPGLPALFLSGYTPDEVLRQGVRAEEAHFLQKPFTPSSLLGKVREVLARPSAF
jgi:PAS domain S-box-containing protein